MKQRHTQAIALNAKQVLRAANVRVGQNFYTLHPSQVDIILEEADRVRYRKPKLANGSRGRYFYERLQREAIR